MKVIAAALHNPLVAARAAVRPTEPGREPFPTEKPAEQDFVDVYRRWFSPVCRFLRARGAPEADLEDLAQEVFLIVRRRLVDFDGRNMGAWLYRISARAARDHLRRAWLRRLIGLGDRIAELPEGGRGPEGIAARSEEERLVWRLLGDLSAKHRAALVLFEIEGYSCEEIASLEEVPLQTVWSRLHYARKEFSALVRRHRALKETQS